MSQFSNQAPEIDVDGIRIAWDRRRGTCTFDGLPISMMWVDSTLAGLMSGLHAMVGTARFALALQSEGRNSVDADWAVISTCADFRDGFEAIAKVAAVAGWGDWSIRSLDRETRTCRIRVHDSWEGRYQQALGACWGSAMLAGKLAGYCTRLFSTNCWAEQTRFIAKGDDYDEFEVRPSSRTIEAEIDQLLACDEALRADMAVAVQRLQAEIATRQQVEESLRESEARFRALFDSSSDPIYLLEDGVFVDCNPAALQLLGGVEREQVIGKTPVDFSHIDPEYPHSPADLAREKIEAALAGHPQLFDWPASRPDGSTFTIEARLTRVGLDQRNLLQVVCRDITERKAMEKRLRESEEKYRAIFDESIATICLFDRNGKIIDCNRAGLDLLGYSRDELLEMHTQDLDVNPERMAPGVARLIAGERLINVEHELRGRDGRIIQVLNNSHPLTDEHGKVTAILTTLIDVTQRKQAERQLRENATRDRSLLDNLPQLIWQKSCDGVYENCNASYARRIGLTPDGIIGKTDDDFFPAALAEKYRRDDQQLLAAGQTATFDESWVKDGTERLVQITKIPLMDVAGKRFGTLGIADDVTDRRCMERALREREELYSAIFNQAADGIVLVDADSLDIVEFNDAACNTLGYSRDDFAGLGIPDIQGELTLDEIKVQQQQINAVGESCFETLHRRKDGSLRIVDVRKRVLDLRGRRCWVATWRDVTDARKAETALREEAERRRLMFAHSQDGIAVVDFDCRLVEWNPRFGAMLGYEDEELAQLHVWDWDQRWSREELLSLIPTIPLEGLTNETRHRRKDGTEYDVEISHSPVEWGGKSYLFSLHRNITERKQAEQALRESEQFLQGLFDAIQDGISVLDQDFRVVRTNAWMDQHYAHQGPLIGRPCYSVFQNRTTGCKPCPAAATFEDGNPHSEIVPFPNAASPQGWLELSTYPLVDANGRVTQVIEYAKDITAQRRYQQRLEHVALYDPLTDLPNRALLAERLHQAMAQAQRSGRPLALGYLDLDGFKAINDQHGHDVGDALLVVVAGRVSQVLREVDTVARLGGDEFVILLADFSISDQGHALLGRILSAVAKPVHASDLMLQVSASLGVTLYPQPEEIDADHLLRQADQAMYQAKVQGKNQFQFFDIEEARHQRGQHESLGRLHQALRDEEFVLYYQPQVNLRTGEIIGAEALVRWQHPMRGLLLPAVFLPMIENQPLGLDVEQWIFKRVLAQMEQWLTQGLTLRVSINISAYQLQQPNFTERLAHWLGEHPNLDPASLELEVLETSALDDLVAVSQVMRQAAQLGVRFALDDFGTGYSSLIYLKLLPADVLKIDRTFVRDMLIDPDDLAILEGIRGMARAFRRQVIAEGVETQAHGELLLQLGCELAQGCAIAHPMPAGELPGWIKEWSPPECWTKVRTPVAADDQALLFAGVEHRRWIHDIEAFVRGGQDSPPSLAPDGCRFGEWLHGAASERFAGTAQLADLYVAHEEVHRLGGELIRTRDSGNTAKRDELLQELHGQQNALLCKLNLLIE